MQFAMRTLQFAMSFCILHFRIAFLVLNYCLLRIASDTAFAPS